MSSLVLEFEPQTREYTLEIWHSTTLNPIHVSVFNDDIIIYPEPIAYILQAHIYLARMFLKVVFSSVYDSSPVAVSPGGSPSMPGTNPAYTPQVSGRRRSNCTFIIKMSPLFLQHIHLDFKHLNLFGAIHISNNAGSEYGSLSLVRFKNANKSQLKGTVA